MKNLSQAEKAALLGKLPPGAESAYVYFSSRIRERYALLKANVGQARIYYSLKANPHPGIVGIFQELGAGADVASLGELEIALAQGFRGVNISFVGPGKSDRELRRAVDVGCLVVVESLGEAIRLNELGRRSHILVRVNPRAYLSASGREVSLAPSQFGIDEEQLPEFFRRLKTLRNLDFLGLHVFNGSNFLRTEDLLRNFEANKGLCEEIVRLHGVQVKTLDMGGGLGIPYFEGQSELDVTRLSKLSFPGDLILESGRYLVGESGFFVTRVLDRKVSRGKTYLIVAGGMNHHLAAAGFGQAVRRNFAFGALSPQQAGLEKVTIAGPTCYSLDILASDVEIPVCEVGDYIFVASSGAYGPSFSPSGFLSRDPVLEILI